MTTSRLCPHCNGVLDTRNEGLRCFRCDCFWSWDLRLIRKGFDCSYEKVRA